MSAPPSGDVSLINDEDLLRKMWQDTEDFGRKKEIRAHMYKVREARLKDFYNSSEVNTDIKTTKTTTESKSCPTHADSLADHSFISMKTKEIRDSESPTRDVSYRITDKTVGNQGWNVVSKNETSQDGKTVTTSKIATTSGTEQIEGGKIDYAAKNEQQASVYKDGDDKNFTKAVGASSSTLIKQEASGGDENSSFKSSSTKTSSSSKFVSEHKSTSGDVTDRQIIPRSSNYEDATLVSRKTYTENIPSELKNHPSFVEGKTKVTRETRTLPDGTTVTTTKYEIRGGSTSKAVKSNQFASTTSSHQDSKSNQFTSTHQDSRTNQKIQQPAITTTTTRYEELHPTTTSQTIKSSSSEQHSSTSKIQNSANSRTNQEQSINYEQPSSSTIVTKYEEPQKIDSSSTSRHVDSSSTSTRVVKDRRESSSHTINDSKQAPTTSTFKTTVVKTIEEPHFDDTCSVTSTRTYDVTEPQVTRVTQENQKFITTEQRDNQQRSKPQEKFDTPERRQPIKPGKSELDQKTHATEGQYDTTYRSDYTNKRISVDLSPTHEAFARSLRAVSPDRISSRGSLRTSTGSLRSSTSPEKFRSDRRSSSPKKNSERFSSTDTITYRNKDRTDIDTSTLTRKKKPRSPSPTSIASDIEFVTDLDTNETIITKARPSTLEVTKKTTTTDRREDRPLKRTDTYEERCRQILGITSENSKRRDSLEKITTRRGSGPRSPTKDVPSPIRKSPEKRSPTKPINGFPSQTRRSPQKVPLGDYPERKRPQSKTPSVNEFPAQIRKSPEKQPLGEYPEKKRPQSRPSSINEFPSQIRKSPEKQTLGDYPEKKRPQSRPPSVSEFPSQIRRSPEREVLGEYPDKKRPTSSGPTTLEFPSQIRKSPERQALGEYPEKKRPQSSAPKINEFPSQIRRSPEREPLQEYPEKKKPKSSAPRINEFPSQIRKSPERQPLGEYPEKKRPQSNPPGINEFPSQIRKSPERQPLGEYPEKKKSKSSGPNINEFPSQIRRSPEKEPLGEYPEKKKPKSGAPKINEFLSQIRKSPEREPLGEYPEKKRPQSSAPGINEFPSQIRKSPEREPLGEYPEKKKSKSSVPKINEFPSQIRKSPEREPLGEYPKKKKSKSSAPKINEFPSQIRKSPEREPLGEYPDKKRPQSHAPEINEFPSQIRRSPEREPLGKYQEKKRVQTEAPHISEFPSQTRRESPERKIADEPVVCEFSPEEERYPKREPSQTYLASLDDLNKKSPERSSPTRKPDKTEYRIHPTSPSKKEKPRKRTDSSSSTTSEEVEEITTITKITELEGKVPVNEAVVTKKFISQLCQEDEIDRRSTASKKNTQTILEQLVKSEPKQSVHKTVKKDLSKKKFQEEFITKERKDTEINKYTTTKKPLTEKNTINVKKITTTITKKIEDKPKPKDVKKTTITDIENMRRKKEDRSSITIDKKKTVVNGDVKKGPLIDNKPRKTVTTSRTTVTKESPKRHVVTATINVSPKSKPTAKATPKKPKLQNGHVTSEESIVDSLEAEDITTKKQKTITRTTSERILKKKPEARTPVRGFSKPELLEKKVITTKTININNENDEEREIIVNLQRSISSREPSPDRVCPRPVSSDDDDPSPRYPDQVTEPDDSSLRRKPKKLSDIPIFEDTELTTKITEIDRVEETDESLLSVDQKISKFLDTAKEVTKIQGVAPKIARPKLEVDEDLKSDECLLSVSEKVNKFVSTSENLGTPQDVARPKSPKCRFYPEEDVKVSQKVQKFISAAEKVVKPENKAPAPKVSRPKLEVDERTKDDECLLSVSDKVSKFASTTDKVSLSKIVDRSPSPSRRSPSPTKQSPKSTSPTRSSPSKETTPTRRPSNQYSSIKTESVETKYSRRDSSPKQPDSTPRSVLSPTGRLRSTETIKKARALFENVSNIPKDILSRPSVFEPRKPEEIRRSQSPEGDVPGYMKPLDRGVRHFSPHRQPEETRRSESPEVDVPGYMKPLDRSLRHNSPHKESIDHLSKKHISKEETEETGFERTSKTTTFDEITEEEVEEIYELEFLEQLLEKVIGYDIRRKIRTQIRLVKKLISEGKLVEVISKKTTTSRGKSPVKTTVIREKSPIKSTTESKTEYQSSFSSYSERRSSSEYSKVTRRSQSPEKTAKGFQTHLKKTTPASKPSTDSTPEWVRQRILKKPSERTTVKTTTTSTTTKKSRSSPSKEIDSITSSYGVGPTDENGSPLFGLKALRAKNKTETTKVQGTVIKSQFYSENGKEPVGEISVTKYSTDPKDLGRSETKGLTSVTTTQKFGYKDTPSLKSLTKSQKTSETTKDEAINSTKSSKFTRRGSVKALSQKFIENAVETSKSERQSSYPKAGLILRTSSFKDSSSGDSREGSSERTVTVKTSTTRTGETFLTNRSKVTGVQDVITRMKTEDIREGESAQDKEARGLLNKFIGSQVILSGLESGGSQKRSTSKITTTITERGKPVTRTRTFNHPITDEELQSVWDEQTLKLLLEQSTDYEERRRIRARLRQVMAEQEACTDLVEKASQEQTSSKIEENQTKKTFTEGPVTATQVTTTKVTTQQTKKPISPFAKFRQLDKQNSLNTPPSTPRTPSGSGPLFKFTDPALSQSASTVKDRLLYWCRMKTKEYENIQLDNFSTSWADGLAFCALIHHFLPDAFDYHALSPKNRRHNFTIAFQVADEKADIAPLLDVDDMVATRRPDWKCVFTYVQSIYRRFKDED